MGNVKFDCEFDPFCDGYIWENYTKLAVRDVFSKLPVDFLGSDIIDSRPELLDVDLADLDKIIRFTIVFADPLSPMASERDFEFRVNATISLLNHKGERYISLVKSGHFFFHLMLYEYFKMVNSFKYESWFSAKMGLHQMNLMLRTGAQKDLDRLKYMQSIESLTLQVVKMEAELFPDPYTAKIIAEQATKSRLGGYAEQYALII